MNQLEMIAEQVRQKKIEEIQKEAEEITKAVLSEVTAVRYPFDLFVSKWYIPFRAKHTFGVDTTQLAAYLGNGNDTSRIKTSLFGQWLAVCVHEMNNVSLYDMKTGKHVMYLPPLMRSPFMRKGVTSEDIDINRNLVRVVERFTLGRFGESNMWEKAALSDAEHAYDFEENRRQLHEDWVKSLDYVDELLGRRPEDMIEQIRSYLPIEILNTKNVKNIENPTTTQTKSKHATREDILSAFE